MGSASATFPDGSDGAKPGAAAVQDLVYLGFQGRFLEAGPGRSAEPPFAVDGRSIVMARAMRHASDGTGDLCSPGHLSPGPLLGFGATPLEFLRQLGRKGTAPASARAGGRSWTDLRRGLIGWDGPRGMMTQVLAGAALAFRQRGEDRAALVFEEFAATDTGAWHEGFNMAAAQRVPLIVVLDAGRGDGHGDSARVEAIARAYGAVAESVAEEPYARIFEVVAEARARAVGGRGPTLIALLPPGDGPPWAGHDAFVAWARAECGYAEEDVAAIERAALAGVEHALQRLAKEPGAEPRDALVPVCEGENVVPPWTRLTPPDPGERTFEAPVEGRHVR